jgi:hypothetical protein
VRVLDILEQAAATLALPHPAPQQVRTTLQRKSHLCIPRKLIARLYSQFHIHQSPIDVLMCTVLFVWLSLIPLCTLFCPFVPFLLLLPPPPHTFPLFSIPPIFLFLSSLFSIHFLSFPPCSFLPTLFPSFLLHPRSCTFFLCPRSLLGFFAMPPCALSFLSTLHLSALLDLLKVPFSL